VNFPADDLVPCFDTAPSKTQLAALFEKGSRASDIPPLDIAKILNRMKVFYVFVGGVIVGCWTGDPRATEDVNLILGKGAPVRKIVAAIGKIRKDLKSTIYPSVIRFEGKSPTGQRNLIDLIRPYDGVYSHAEEYFVDITVQGVPVRIPTGDVGCHEVCCRDELDPCAAQAGPGHDRFENCGPSAADLGSIYRAPDRQFHWADARRKTNPPDQAHSKLEEALPRHQAPRDESPGRPRGRAMPWRQGGAVAAGKTVLGIPLAMVTWDTKFALLYE
jgi:hypothetical protein